MALRPWLHWPALVLASVVPLAVSQRVLDETVSCRQFNLDLVTLAKVFNPPSFRIPPPVYEAIYKFGVAGTLLVFLVAVASATSIAIVIASMREKRKRVIGAIVVVVACVVFAWFAPISWVSPHSCLSVDLIEVTAGMLPDDDAIAASRYEPIGNTGKSLKVTFEWIYRVLLGGWLISLIALGTMLHQLRSKVQKPERAPLTAKANQRLTLVIAVFGAILATCVAAVHEYHAIGSSVLQAFSATPADGSASVWISAYTSYSSAVELHWGGVASMVVGSIYLTTLGFIWLRSAKWGIDQGIALKDTIALLVKFGSIGAPFLTVALQQWAE